MSDSFEHEADDLHDVPVAMPLPVADLHELTDEQAEDDFDFDFDDDFAEEFADEWEPVTAAAELVEVEQDGEVMFVVNESTDAGGPT